MSLVICTYLELNFKEIYGENFKWKRKLNDLEKKAKFSPFPLN